MYQAVLYAAGAGMALATVAVLSPLLHSALEALATVAGALH